MSLTKFSSSIHFIYRISCIILLTSLLVGCTTRLANYEPMGELREKKNKSVIIQPICFSESYYAGFDPQKKLTIQIIDITDLCKWVNDALTKELMNAGYSVVISNECVEDQAYTITHGPFKDEDGLITIPINVSQGETRVFSRQYRAHQVMKAELWEFLVPGRQVVQPLFVRSLQDICADFIEDLDSLLPKFRHSS